MTNFFDTVVEANAAILETEGFRYILKKHKMKKRLKLYIDSIKGFKLSMQLILDFAMFVSNTDMSTMINDNVDRDIRFVKITDTACNIVFYDKNKNLLYNIHIIDGNVKIITYNVVLNKDDKEGVFPKDQIDAIVTSDLSSYSDTDMAKAITHIMYEYTKRVLDNMNNIQKRGNGYE